MFEFVFVGIGFLLFVYCCWMLLAPFTQERVPFPAARAELNTGVNSESSYSERNKLIDALAELEEDYRGGKVEGVDYQSRKGQITERLNRLDQAIAESR